MKEFSIEQKAKAYDEAIKRVENIRTGKCETTFMFTEGLLEHIFPELKKSEDERIKEKIIATIHLYYGEPLEEEAKEMIAWLEKQGEQKPDNIDNKFIRMRETKPKDISEFLDRLTTVEQEFLWEHIAKIRELDKEEQKSTEWSEEEEEMLNLIIARLHSHPNVDLEEYSKEYDWLKNKLKFLKPQSTWKPSKEQMKALNTCIMQEECNITGIKSKHATEKLKECIDNVSEESLAKAHKQLQEELVSHALEEVVEEIVDPTVLNAYGVKEIANRLRRTMIGSVSEDLERAAGDYEHNMWKEGHPEDTYNSSDIIKAVKFGAQWKEQQMMAKAVNAVVKVDAGGYPYIPHIELYDYYKDAPLAKGGDKYKVILIKEG